MLTHVHTNTHSNNHTYTHTHIHKHVPKGKGNLLKCTNCLVDGRKSEIQGLRDMLVRVEADKR